MTEEVREPMLSGQCLSAGRQAMTRTPNPDRTEQRSEAIEPIIETAGRNESGKPSRFRRRLARANDAAAGRAY
eukprot:15451920-Alexandrium_andersonii.AAC.1